MSYSYHDSKQNVWRAPASREHGFESNFSLPTRYPTYGNPSENVAMNGVRSLLYPPPSLQFTSAGYPQASCTDRPSQRFAEETPDSTSLTVVSNIDTGPRVYQRSSNQASTTKEGLEVIHSTDGISGYLPNTTDSNLLPSPASFMPSGRDLNSLQVDSGCYPMNSFITYPLQAASYSQMGNYSRRIDGLGTQNLEPGPQKKTESWLIAKFLDSVHSSENQPNACSIPAADSAQQPQTIPMNFPAGSRPQPNVQSFLGKYSKDRIASAAVDLEKTIPRENSDYCWRPPPSNTTMRNASPKDGEKVGSSSKMKQDEKLPKKESGVDSGTLGAWTEYFRQLYLFNVINHQHGETQTQNVPGIDVATSLPVDPPKPVPKLGYSTNRGAAPLTNKLRGRVLQKPLAAISGSGELGVASSQVIPSKAYANRPTEEKLLGCRLCGLEDMHWNSAEFQKHVSSEEHRRRYKRQTLHLDSRNDPQHPSTLQLCCKVCNLTITESFSAHNRRTEHLERKALIQRGCQLCKVNNFPYYKEYSIHMNGKEHKENQMKSRLPDGSSAKNTDNSVNIVDSTQDKSANPDLSGSPNEATPKKKISQMITQSEKMIRTAFRPTAPQKPKIEIKLSSRQPLLAADWTKPGLARKIPEHGLAGNKRMADKLETSDVMTVEDGTGEELQKRLKIGNVNEPSVGSLPMFPATANATDEKNRKQISSEDDLQMVKNDAVAAANELSSNSLKDASTATVIQAESCLLECKTKADKTSNGAEAEAVLLSPVSEVDVVSSPKESAEQNNRSTVNQQNEDVFVAVVGFYCKVCKTIYNKEEVSEEQHRQSETHLTNLQAVVHLPLSSSPGPFSSPPLPATSKQPKHNKENEVNIPKNNVTDTSKVVDEAHQEMKALKKPGNTAKDPQHLTNQLVKGTPSQHLVHVNADHNSQDGARPSDDLGKQSTCKSNGLSEHSAEISSPRPLEEQSPKKLKTADGSARKVQQQKNDENEQLEPPDLEASGNSTTKQGPRKRKLILPNSSMMTCRNPQGNSKDVQKKMEDILEKIVSQEKAKDTQTDRQEVEKKIQTTNKEPKVRSNVSIKKPLVIARTSNFPREPVHIVSTAAGKSDTIALVQVKEEPPETDSSLKLTTVKETSYVKNQAKRIETNRQNLKTNRPGMRFPSQTHFPSTGDTQQLNESTSCGFNQPSIKQEVMTTRESTSLQGGTIQKTFAPKSVNDSLTIGPSSETESQKNNGTIQMTERSAMPARNVNDNMTENSVAVLADKHSGFKLNSEPVINPGVKLINPGVKLNSGAVIDPAVKVKSRAIIDPGVKVNSEGVINPGVKINSKAVKPDVKLNSEPVINPGVKLNSEPGINPGVKIINPGVKIINLGVKIINPGVKVNSEAVTKAGRDLLEHFNADVKNKGNTNKQPVGKMASDGKKPDNGKTIIVNNSANSEKAVTSDKNVTNERSTPVSSDNTGNTRGKRTIANDTSGASEKSVTNYKMVPNSQTVTNHKTAANDKTLYNNKAIAISPVDGRAATKDGTTQMPAVTISPVVGRAATKDGTTQMPAVAISPADGRAATKDGTTQMPAGAISPVVGRAATKDGTNQQNIVPAVAISPADGRAATKDGTTQMPAVAISPVVGRAATKDGTNQQNIVPAVAISPADGRAATKDGATAVAISPVDVRPVTKDGTNQQNVVPAVAFNKSVVDKTVVDNKTCETTAEELAGSKVGIITAVTVNTSQSASNHKNSANIANSKPQDANSKTNSSTASAQNDKSINKSSISENCQTDSMSKSVDTKGVGSSTEAPNLVDSSENSDSSISTKNEVANVVLPASLEKGCTVS